MKGAGVPHGGGGGSADAASHTCGMRGVQHWKRAFCPDNRTGTLEDSVMALRDIFCFKYAREHAARQPSRLDPERTAATPRCAYCNVAIVTGMDTYCAKDMKFCCKTHRLVCMQQARQLQEMPVGMRRRASTPTLSDCTSDSAAD